MIRTDYFGSATEKVVSVVAERFKFIAIAGFFLSTLGGVQYAEASYVSTHVRTGGCDESSETGYVNCREGSLGPTAGSIAIATARAEVGSLGVFASSDQYTPGGISVASGHSIWSSFSRFDDQLTFDVQEGFLRIGFDISGTVDLQTTGDFRGSNALSSQAGVKAYLAGSLIYEDFLSIPDPLTSLAVEHTTFGSIGENIIDIAFTEGQLSLTGAMFAYSECGNQYDPGSSCSSTVDFLHSANLMAAVVLDVNGDQILGSQISSQSGFNYAAGFVSAVPVPAALPLFGTGLAVMGLIGWRRKRKAA